VTSVIHVGSNATPEAVTAAVAARAGRDEVTVRSLLYGAEPASDEALVAIADQLDQLEAEVRRQ
jgi:cyanate lyase